MIFINIIIPFVHAAVLPLIEHYTQHEGVQDHEKFHHLEHHVHKQKMKNGGDDTVFELSIDQDRHEKGSMHFIQLNKKLENSYPMVNAKDIEYSTVMTIQQKKFYMLLDSGSSEMWLPSATCNDHQCFNHVRYEVTDKISRQTLAETTNKNLDEVKVTYGSGEVVGKPVCDDAYFGYNPNDLVHHCFLALGECHLENFYKTSKFDGLIGLSFPRLKIWRGKMFLEDYVASMNKLHSESPHYKLQFAFFFSKSGAQHHVQDDDSTPVSRSVLYLGEYDPECALGPINFHPVQTNKWWECDGAISLVKYKEPESISFLQTASSPRDEKFSIQDDDDEYINIEQDPYFGEEPDEKEEMPPPTENFQRTQGPSQKRRYHQQQNVLEHERGTRIFLQDGVTPNQELIDRNEEVKLEVGEKPKNSGYKFSQYDYHLEYEKKHGKGEFFNQDGSRASVGEASTIIFDTGTSTMCLPNKMVTELKTALTTAISTMMQVRSAQVTGFFNEHLPAVKLAMENHEYLLDGASLVACSEKSDSSSIKTSRLACYVNVDTPDSCCGSNRTIPCLVFGMPFFRVHFVVFNQNDVEGEHATIGIGEADPEGKCLDKVYRQSDKEKIDNQAVNALVVDNHSAEDMALEQQQTSSSQFRHGSRRRNKNSSSYEAEHPMDELYTRNFAQDPASYTNDVHPIPLFEYSPSSNKKRK